MSYIAAIWLTFGLCSWMQIITDDRPIGDGSNPRLLSWKQAITVTLPATLILGPCMWAARLYNEFAYHGPNE